MQRNVFPSGQGLSALQSARGWRYKTNGIDQTRSEIKPAYRSATSGGRPIVWKGGYRTLAGVYEFHINWENFTGLFTSLPFPAMLWNSLIIVLIGEVAVLILSIICAYGFARFKLLGGNLIFYILIATILIPDKITTIPAYFVYVIFFHWHGTLYPILLPLFFGNAVYIFLLRQNFRSIPVDLEKAAMLDGCSWSFCRNPGRSW